MCLPVTTDSTDHCCFGTGGHQVLCGRQCIPLRAGRLHTATVAQVHGISYHDGACPKGAPTIMKLRDVLLSQSVYTSPIPSTQGCLPCEFVGSTAMLQNHACTSSLKRVFRCNRCGNQSSVMHCQHAWYMNVGSLSMSGVRA